MHEAAQKADGCAHIQKGAPRVLIEALLKHVDFCKCERDQKISNEYCISESRAKENIICHKRNEYSHSDAELLFRD